MKDEQEQPPDFQSETETSNGALRVALPIVVAVVTFFVSLGDVHNGSDGGLNGLNGIFAGAYALGAFIVTLAVVMVVAPRSR